MSTLDKQLSRLAQGCEMLDADRWQLALTNGRSLSVSAHHDEGFLLLDADPGFSAAAENVVPLAMRARELAATLKPALRGGGPGVRLRAEFPLPEESEAAEERVRGYLEGMRSAMHRLHDGFSCEAAAEGMACPKPEGDWQAINGSLPELLKEAGWPYHERPNSELLVDLETGDTFLQAGIAHCGAGVRFSVMLYRSAAVDELAQQALSLYLLEANAALRYARAFLQREGEEISAGFEVCVESAPSVAEVGHALAALSVAGRLCARELKVLGGPMAGIYRSARPPFYQPNNQGA